MTKIKLSIEGMHCGSCAAGIKMILDNTEGVKNSWVDYKSKEGETEFDETKVKVEDIIKSIEDLGYKAKIL
ncbi:MAG: hypothetical protein A3H02_01545 [Candidatus Niyogibacteria bacterium RIFCSPLOWO2_12_FULL_41_13]|uniref:HMA domain-containing protein n=1 Tax=Candidatus Niyogibacteria bacterium RIFCSPLOWO2_12_FULL_41_13 TaxID=1801726 RepID=A0A1G2F489_9BACT|nr:MAG: hypothetical protein A3H02_01545 [Candidatus Niyogibacteria bacterium RIFCSPLOWO2_12_FULL_41_13]